MFTGLVAETGRIRAIERVAGGSRLGVVGALAAELDPGDSVAVAGVCLTAVQAGADAFAVEVMAETLARSSFGTLTEGRRVNLELPLRPADRLGGHVVQGHVDGIGRVRDVAEDGLSRRVRLAADPGLCRYLVERGSVALDGVSLTVAEPGEDEFAVVLIPETLARTTLGELGPGDPVNVEVDVLAKYVERLTRGGAAATLAGAGGPP